MASLFYIDEDGTLKTVANTSSPIFVGEPCTNSIDEFNDRDILNVNDATRYIDSVIGDFNISRLVFSNSNKLENLIEGKKYMISVYGKFNPGLNSDTYNIGPVVLRDSNNRILKASGTIVKNLVNPKCIVPQDATLILDEAPEDGIVFGLIDFNTDDGTGVYATSMVAIRLS